MIVPMKKVSLVALAADGESALAALRELGVMEIVRTGAAESQRAAASSEAAASGRRTFSSLKNNFSSPEERPDDPAALEAVGKGEILTVARALLTERAALQQELSQLSKRDAELAPFGEFDRTSLEALNGEGVHVWLCRASEAAFQAAEKLPGILLVQKLSESHGSVAFAVFSRENEPPADSGLVPLVLAPGEDLAAIHRRSAALSARLAEIDATLTGFGSRALPAAGRELSALEAQLEFERVRDALSAYGEVVALTGFVPEPELEALRQAAQTNGWAILAGDPEPGDRVPTLIERAKWVSIIAPFFDFLGIAPGYDEYDVSSGVLVFFTIFYAMIVGDAGYGLLFLAATLLAAWKLRKKPAAKPALQLFGLLSIATIVCGLLNNNLFGCAPKWLNWCSLSAFTDAARKGANTQFVCFSLALLQLVLGHCWKALNLGTARGWFSNLGWSTVIFANFFLIVKLLVYPGALPAWLWWVYGAGLALVAIFEVNWRDVGDVFQFPFNVIGSFSEVLSYIRLFAVGLAGYYIAKSFNDMGKSVFAVNPWLCALPAAFVILFGHVLNIALCLMSVMVHGVRLNTLEFSSHAGIRWGGSRFQPFSNQHTNKGGSK